MTPLEHIEALLDEAILKSLHRGVPAVVRSRLKAVVRAEKLLAQDFRYPRPRLPLTGETDFGPSHIGSHIPLFLFFP